MNKDNVSIFKSEAVQDMLGNTLFKVLYRQANGKEIIKTISVEDYISLIKGSVVQSLKYSRLPEGFLPEGYIDGYFADGKNYTALWQVPARMRTINHYKAGRKLIPFPALVFSLSVSNGHCSGDVFAIKGDKLYQYPFGNVDTSGGICMGNITVQDIETGPKAFEDDFFAGVTNDDYFQPGNHVTLKCTQVDLINKLAGLDKFPDKWLLRSRSDFMTLDDLKKDIIRK